MLIGERETYYKSRHGLYTFNHILPFFFKTCGATWSTLIFFLVLRLFSCSGVTEMIFVTHATDGVSVNFLAECKKIQKSAKSTSLSV